MLLTGFVFRSRLHHHENLVEMLVQINEGMAIRMIDQTSIGHAMISCNNKCGSLIRENVSE